MKSDMTVYTTRYLKQIKPDVSLSLLCLSHRIIIYSQLKLFICKLHKMTQSEFFLSVARWSVYLTTIEAMYKISTWIYDTSNNGKILNFKSMLAKIKTHLLISAVSISIVFCSEERLYGYEFLSLAVAYLIYKCPELLQEKKATVSYGMGMACSFVEGYLHHVIPSNGSEFVGFTRNIDIYEAKENIIFPVKRLFIICTKTMYCPPDLTEFNKENSDLPVLEAMKSLEDVEKNVAGVKNRLYRNSAYKINRPGASPVHLAVECATPLHTLYRARSRTQLQHVLKNVDPKEVVDDFCSTLETLLKDPEYRNKCEIVYFDDTKDYLPNVLLERIRAIEPDFENIIKTKK
ncbi:unnamed protein product, partial [Brenthis ino]